MLFNSPGFVFVFLPIVLVVFYSIARARRTDVAICWLVLASLFFYGYWNPIYLVLLASSILVNYSVGVWLAGFRRTKPAKRAALILGIVFNLSLLGYFKYANFFVDTVQHLGAGNFELDRIVLPLAISFFTFQQIAYLVDAWRGEAREYSFLHYCLFVTFFPQLIAGPIVHHKEMLPQFMADSTYRFKLSNLSIGLSIFIIGLFKKVVIADNFALLASPAFAAAESGDALYFVQVAKGVLGYTFQLYFDFSGYSDMAIGLARMFGIRLPLNFNSPYRSVNIIDFWRRWHMTLSRFLKDYVYIALGGNRKGRVRRYVNLLVTMLLGGLWHGAGWTFVFWGALHGVYLVINHAWHRVWKRNIGTWWSIGIARIVTLLSVMFAWIFFRAESFQGAVAILKGFLVLPRSMEQKLGPLSEWFVAAGFEFGGPNVSPSDYEFAFVAILMTAIVWYAPNTQQLFSKFRPAYDYGAWNSEPNALQSMTRKLYWRPTIAWAAAIALLGVASLMSLSSVSEFLYFQF